MTERDRNELTNQPNSLNLEGRGNIMPDGTSGTPEQPQQPEPSIPGPTEGEGFVPRDMSESARKAAREAMPGKIIAPTLAEQKARFEALDPLSRARINKLVQNTFGDIGSDDAMISEARDLLVGSEALRESRGEEEKKVGVPENLEDLAKLIMKMSDIQWQIGEKKALIEYDKNGQEKVNPVHFIEWYRANMIRIHNADPLTPVNYFGDSRMSVRNDVWGSMISFGEIVFQENLFLDKKIDKDGKETRVSNPDYKLLRDQMLMEVFLFSMMRNADIEYTTGRGANKQMMEAITKAFTVNPLTRAHFFEFIMTMPSMSKESHTDLIAGDHEKIYTKREGNYYMGDAVRQALSAYINIFDYDQLTRILGEDSQLFSFEYDKYNQETGQLLELGGNKTELDIKDRKSGTGEHSRQKEWFNDDGSLKLFAIEISGRNKGMYLKDSSDKYIEDKNGRPHPKYLDYINVFLNPNPDPRQQTEVRERIALSIMKQTGISYEEAKLAEVWAFSMTHINGVAARNDTQSVAFDWWTRLTNFQDYRKRQKAEKRGAKYGGNYNLEGLKRIGLNYFEAARDINETTIQEIIQGGQGTDVGIGKKLIKETDVDYERDEHGAIVFFNENGEKREGISAKSFEYFQVQDAETDKKVIKTKFFDENGQEVNVDGSIAKLKFTRKNQQVTFKADLQKQFLPNHMYTAASVYEHILNQMQMNFPDMVKGYDSHGNPIVDQEKIDKVKSEIEHDIRYSLSTWPEINYDNEFVMWERKEVRSASGKLMSKNFKGKELDENWYVIGTQERDEPETYLISKKSTILESMFGVDALKYIQFEIEKRGLNHGTKVKEIEGTSFGGKQETVSVDLSATDDEQFKIAIWRGAFDYMVASEIAAHRDRGSGFEWYDTEKMIKTSLALKKGEFITPDQIKNIQKETGTTWKNLIGKDLAYVFAQSGVEGFWKVFQLIFRDVLSDTAKRDLDVGLLR